MEVLTTFSETIIIYLETVHLSRTSIQSSLCFKNQTEKERLEPYCVTFNLNYGELKHCTVKWLYIFIFIYAEFRLLKLYLVKQTSMGKH